ncbi:MAG TPA: phosphate ABC transporter permease subunit PstC, partial [Allocoleopsis sp.]
MTKQPSTPEQNYEDLFNPNRRLSKNVELGVKIIFGTFAAISVVTTIGFVLTLIFETIEFFKTVSILRFFTEIQWSPLFANPKFGIWVLISATFLTSIIAIIVALPLGLLAAICLSEYASTRVRKILKPALEILAGIPTVVFGYFALLSVTPFLQKFLPGLQGFNALSAGLILGVSIIPLVASL